MDVWPRACRVRCRWTIHPRPGVASPCRASATILYLNLYHPDVLTFTYRLEFPLSLFPVPSDRVVDSLPIAVGTTDDTR